MRVEPDEVDEGGKRLVGFGEANTTLARHDMHVFGLVLRSVGKHKA